MDTSVAGNLSIIRTLRSIQHVLRHSKPTDWVEALRVGGSLFPHVAMRWQRLDGAGNWQNVALTAADSPFSGAKSWTEGAWRLQVDPHDDPLVEAWAGALFDCFNQHAQLADARTELHSCRSDYDTLRSAGFEGICIHRAGNLLEMNDAFLRLYGYTREEMVGMHMSQTITAETLPRITSLVSEGFEGVYETQALRKDGTTVQLEAQATNCTFRGQPARVAAFRDIRGLKAIAIALEKAKKSAETANELKTQFLGDISHELRTPLNAVLGSIDLLRASTLDADQERLLGVAGDNARDLMELLNDLLDFTRMEENRLELRIEPFHLSVMLQNAVRSMRRVRDGVCVHTQIDSALAGYWLGDERRIRQIVLNLLENAAKFTEQGEIRLDARKVGTKVQIAVSDTGVGISENLKKSLFHRFAQGEESRGLLGGNGLGLHISHRLAIKMGGALRVESELHHGSTFTLEIELPVAVELPRVPMAESSLATKRQPLTVLLAEDTPVNQFVVRRMLEAMGHQVEIVDDGEQAVAAVERQHFDVVLMDVQMPRMNGVEATRCVRERGWDTPIYALTANALEPNLESCIHAGMNGYLTKPVSQQQLHDIFSKLAPSPHGDRARAVSGGLD